MILSLRALRTLTDLLADLPEYVNSWKVPSSNGAAAAPGGTVK